MGAGSPSSRTGGVIPTCSAATRTSTSSTSRRAPSRPSRADRGPASTGRPGCRTGGRSPRSGTGSRAAPAAATTCGCSTRTAPTRHRPEAATCPRPHDLMPGSGMSSDVTRGEATPLIASKGGRWLYLSAPVDGSYELWRIAVADGRLERLTEDRHYISGWHAVAAPGRGGTRIAYLRSTATVPPDLWVLDSGRSRGPVGRRLTSLNKDVLADLALREPIERHATVDGRDIQGWFLPAGVPPAPARGRDPRRPAHALRLVPLVGVPAPGRGRASASTTATRAARRATARPSTTPTTATGGRARCATSWPASTPWSRTGWPIRSASV